MPEQPSPSQEDFLRSREESDKEHEVMADAINSKRSLMDKVRGRNKVSPIDVAHDDAISEDKRRQSEEFLTKLKQQEETQRKAELNRMVDKSEALFLEIKEMALSELDAGKEVVYLEIMSGLLRLTKDNRGRVLITGHNRSENLLQIAKEVVEKLTQEYPEREFTVDSY